VTLLARHRQPEAVAALRQQLGERGAVRVAPAFAEASAVTFLQALSAVEFQPGQRMHPHDGHQIWRFGWVPGVGCDHPLCELGRWLAGDGVGWASALVGRALVAAPEPMLFADRANKATFRDPWDAAAEVPGREVAVLVHLTTGPWPAAWGGHLERLDGRDGVLVERLAPAWNAVDVVDLRAPGRWLRQPLIDRHVIGYTVVCGYHG
jgi:hypothetical protein